jgi:hypothetical protein
MDLEFEFETELKNLGLSPKGWPQVLETIKAKLGSGEWEKFSRLHRNFTGYRSESTAARFYGFVFSHGLQLDLNCFRYARLQAILRDLLPEISPGLTILDVGAGAGIIATLLRKQCSPRALVLQDPCVEVRDELQAQGFAVMPHPAPTVPPWTANASESDSALFDLILCVDSLGEINSDDDGLLAKRDSVSLEELPRHLEERYGFAHKLGPWKEYLAPGGRVLLWEPFAYQNAMESLAAILREDGWDSRLVSRAPTRNYLELRLVRLP